MRELPRVITSETELDDVLTEPTDAAVRSLAEVGGDLLILGVGGKMGPTLAWLARRAVESGGVYQRVIGVSRFSDPLVERRLRAAGVETIGCDLLEEGALDRLPDAPNVILIAGRKFGSTGTEDLTWAMNTYLPARVARRYRGSRLGVFSTGNLYALTPVTLGGASEEHPGEPIGEYAQSCLGRERMIEYFSRRDGTPAAIIRLNYAIDVRYGILLDVATCVARGEPIDLTVGNVYLIWQGDANCAVLRSLALCATPPVVLNLTGPETVSVGWLATRIATLLGREPIFQGSEASTALLSNAARAHALFGYPRVPLETMLRWTVEWVRQNGRNLGKPTHFEVRDGRFSEAKLAKSPEWQIGTSPFSVDRPLEENIVAGPRIAVFRSSEFKKISGARKSFQECSNARIATTARTGFDSESMTRAQILGSLHRPIRAASASSAGIVRKNCRTRKM